jgi:hypothetical protein
MHKIFTLPVKPTEQMTEEHDADLYKQPSIRTDSLLGSASCGKPCTTISAVDDDQVFQ